LASEVGAERFAHERVDLDGVALDELGHERLDTKAVERRRSVEEHRVVLDDLLENVPHLGRDALDVALRALDVVGEAALDELSHDERLEELERHLLRQSALVQLEVVADDDDRTPGVVHALAEQVLAEPALLAAEHVRERLELVVAGPRDRAAAAAVVHERVDRLLEHALLVADDDLRRAELEQTLEPVVPVDHAAVEVVQVAGREPAAVELHHGAQVRRDDRKDREDHPLGRRARAEERLHQTEPLDGLLAALPGGRTHLGLELERELGEIDLPHDLEHGLGAHLRAEEAVLVGERAVLGLGLGLERLDAHDLFALALRLVADDLHVGCDVLADHGEVLVGAHPDVGDLLLRIRARLLLFLTAGLDHRVELLLQAPLQLREHRLGHVVALLGDHKVGLLEDDVLRCRLSNVVLELFLDLRRGGRESVGVGGELLLLLADALLGGCADAHDLRRGTALDRAGAVRDRLLEPADLAFRLFLDLLEHALALVLVDVRDEIEREVQDPLEVARGHVEQDA